MSLEMESFDKLPHQIRRALDESTYPVSAAFVLRAVQMRRTTYDAVAERVKGLQSWSDARIFYHELQLWTLGRIVRTMR